MKVLVSCCFLYLVFVYVVSVIYMNVYHPRSFNEKDFEMACSREREAHTERLIGESHFFAFLWIQHCAWYFDSNLQREVSFILFKDGHCVINFIFF